MAKLCCDAHTHTSDTVYVAGPPAPVPAGPHFMEAIVASIGIRSVVPVPVRGTRKNMSEQSHGTHTKRWYWWRRKQIPEARDRTEAKHEKTETGARMATKEKETTENYSHPSIMLRLHQKRASRAGLSSSVYAARKILFNAGPPVPAYLGCLSPSPTG